MSDNNTNISEVDVRGVNLKLHTFNRSLQLCAKMNYEVENLDFIDSLASESVFYDLGACEGRFSIYAALKGHSVYSFEPNKANFETLQMNIKLNNLENKVSIFNLGVGEKDAEAILQIGQPWAGGHQKVVKHDQVRSDLNFDFVESEVISIVSLDSFIRNSKLKAPDVLKIDIDGSEVPFLKGATEVLKQAQLKKMIFELDQNDPHYNFIINFLGEFGFRIQESYQVPNEPTLYNIIFVK